MVATGATKFSGMVRSNSVAGFIVDCLKEETTVEKILSAMEEKYNGSSEAMRADIEKILTKLRSIDALEE
jgi:hypothetical protein